MIKRHLEQKLESALKQYPVVSITGPRQSGKTTLMKSTLKNYDYVSLEDPDYRADAMDDPRGFLGQFTSNVMLDEVQQVPALFSYIQGIVDQVDKPGQFVLSGSHNFLLMERISQSLAGRCAILHLMPFSRSELLGKKPMNISNIGKAVSRTKADTKEKMFDMLFKGFYPRIHDKNLAPQNWLANYYQSYIERDVRNIINIGDVETFGRFVRLCAGRSGQMLNMASLASDSGVSAVTVKRWLSILQASFIVKLLMPHHKNFRKRLVKSPKLYFLDT
nr:ATP-binding protein [Planctomycetota bacterium]